MAGIRRGEVLRFHEAEYKFGLGDLTIRVTEILNRSTIPDWIEIKGIQIWWNGTEGEERQVWIKVAAIPQARTRR